MPDDILNTEVPEEKRYTDKEWKGLLGDKKNETKARQEAQAEAAMYRAETAKLKAELEKKSSTVEDKDTGDPTDIITRAELRREKAALKKEIIDMYTQEKVEQNTEKQNKVIEKSFIVAKEEYTEEKYGIGLSFDEVNEGTKRMILKNKILRDLILNDPNPGEKAYEIGLTDPIIAKRHETYKKTLPPGGRTPKDNLDTKGKTGIYYTPQMVQKLSDAEIDEHYDDIKASQAKWNEKKQV